MFKRTTSTDLDTQPTTTQQGLACAQCECQLFLAPLVAGLESHLFRRTNSEPHKYMHCYQIDINMKRFAWAELADVHLANGAAYGTGKEAQRLYHRVCPNYLSTVAYGKLVRTFAVNRYSTGLGRSVRTPQFDEDFYNVLRRIPPQAPARFFAQSVWVVVLCGTLYASRSSIFSIGKRCRLY